MFEGGHPDHDTIAAMVKCLAERRRVRAFFVPAYNRNPRSLYFELGYFRPGMIKRIISGHEGYNQRKIMRPLRCVNLSFSSKNFLMILPFLFLQLILFKDLKITTSKFFA